MNAKNWPNKSMTTEAGHSVKLKYFAWVREKVGLAEEDILLPASLETVADVIAWQRGRGPEFAEAFASGKRVVRAAVDRMHAKPEASIVSAREIAFFPPVTGG